MIIKFKPKALLGSMTTINVFICTYLASIFLIDDHRPIQGTLAFITLVSVTMYHVAIVRLLGMKTRTDDDSDDDDQFPSLRTAGVSYTLQPMIGRVVATPAHDDP